MRDDDGWKPGAICWIEDPDEVASKLPIPGMESKTTVLAPHSPHLPAHCALLDRRITTGGGSRSFPRHSTEKRSPSSTSTKVPNQWCHRDLLLTPPPAGTGIDERTGKPWMGQTDAGVSRSPATPSPHLLTLPRTGRFVKPDCVRKSR